MTEKFPNLVREIDTYKPRRCRFPNKMNPKKPTPKHIIIEIPKVKDRES